MNYDSERMPEDSDRTLAEVRVRECDSMFTKESK